MDINVYRVKETAGRKQIELLATAELRTTKDYLCVADLRPTRQFRGVFGLTENPHTIPAEVAFHYSAIQGYQHTQFSCSEALSQPVQLVRDTPVPAARHITTVINTVVMCLATRAGVSLTSWIGHDDTSKLLEWVCRYP